MQRLFEIEGDGRKRSPQLVAEDKRLMGDLYKKIFAGGPGNDEVR
jgi:hypothetical protein